MATNVRAGRVITGNQVKNKFLSSGPIRQRVRPIRRAAGYVPFLWICLLSVSVGTLLAQTPDTTRQRPVIRPGVPAKSDTLTPEMARDNNALLVDSLAVDDEDSVATDTVQLSAKVNAEIQKIVPKRASLLSLALPGLGQIYNGQKWKVPIIYAGFASFGYFIVTLGGRYQDYLAGYTIAYNLPNVAGQDPNRTKVATVEGRELTLNQLKSSTDFYRRWRDYNIIFTALFWGLNVVDANVTAHLKTFDLSDSLTLKYEPTVMPSLTGLVPGVKLTMTFKK